jgi:hypothetical protein
MARTKNPAPHAARSAADAATTPAPVLVSAPAGDSPAVAVLAALSAEPGGASVAVIAARAGISTAAARQALIAHEKNGTATRIKGSRPGIADTWTPAAASAAEAAPAPDGGTAEDPQAEAVTAPGPDPAEATTSVMALAEAAENACKAPTAGNLDAALAALETAREQAVGGRRVIKAAASGRRAPAARPRRPCPSVDSVPSGPGTHGRIADGGNPKTRLETHMRW